MNQTICTADGCAKTAKKPGAKYCSMHAERRRLYGSLDLPVRPPSVCSVEGCDRPFRARGYCQLHYDRVRSHGDPHMFLSRSDRTGPLSGMWVGDEVSYSAMHRRVRNLRGSARDQICVDCPRQASHWSYDHADLDERMTPEGWPYSVNPDHYEPRCLSCHSFFDKERGGQRTSWSSTSVEL